MSRFDARIRTRATLVGDDCLHHCVTLAFPITLLPSTINIFPLFFLNITIDVNVFQCDKKDYDTRPILLMHLELN